MTAISMVAVAAMAGLPPTLGFVAKEAAFTALLDEAVGGDGWAFAALIGVVIGSALTLAYGLRFIWGAFWSKRDETGEPRETTEWPDPPIGFLSSPLVLAALVFAGGLVAPMLDEVLSGYADTAPGEGHYHLALWHGLEPALLLSLLTIVGGAGIFWFVLKTRQDLTRRLLKVHAGDVYYLVNRGIDRLSVVVTSLTQRGSLPAYVSTIFLVLIASELVVMLANPGWRIDLDAWQHPAQLVAGPIMIAAGIMAVRARKRYTGVVLVSVTGLGMVVFFSVSGAPDLALTQVLVESVTLIAFTLVLRRLPARLGSHNRSVMPVARAILAIAVGITMAAIAVIATSARVHDPVSVPWPELAYEIGHGRNVVNVALVDLRGWDTMGELSVLVLAATGVASLVFVTDRSDNLERLANKIPRRVRGDFRRRQLVETTQGIRIQSAETKGRPLAWLVGGDKISSESRSILLEVIVRILFHTIIVISLYLLFAGHNLPGGGFAGGLVAGMALVMRYMAGGRYELGAAVRRDAGQLLGAGMIIAVGTAIAPMLFGLNAFTRGIWEADLPIVGHVEFVTSTLFDIGVYLVVIGLVFDVLRSLGAEVDRQMREETSAQADWEVANS
jgi:multicomponent Na+:H+ antiporter subunit A